jgi:glycosyltransferase involved in cell wall biosynthesis
MAWPLKRLWVRAERRLIARSAAVITVNRSIAIELQHRYRLASPPVVVMNCPPRWNADRTEPPRFDRFRSVLPIATEQRILLYQGGFVPGRGLDLMARMLAENEVLRGAVLVYLGYGRLKPELQRLAADSRVRGRVFVLDAVEPEVLLEWTASADLSLIALQPLGLNQLLATPNKLFESLAAGVPVVASQFPEIREIVSRHGVGELCDPTRPEDMAAAAGRILSLPPTEFAHLRERCRRTALEHYNWEHEERALIELYQGLLPPDREPARRSASASASS